MKILKNPHLWSAAFWIWLLVLVILTSMPGTNGPEKFSDSNFRWDYLEHFSLYLFIPILYFLAKGEAFRREFLNRKWLMLISGIIFASVTEIYQLGISGRAFNPVDLLLNLSGLLIGIPPGKFLHKMIYG